VSEGAQILSRKVEILNRYGIHARPAAMIVRVASRYTADVHLEKDGNRVSGKSIMGLMTLEASCGTCLVIYAQGPDAAAALKELADLIARGFDEE
jgi:phosphocarrier protein HPr